MKITTINLELSDINLVVDVYIERAIDTDHETDKDYDTYLINGIDWQIDKSKHNDVKVLKKDLLEEFETEEKIKAEIIEILHSDFDEELYNAVYEKSDDVDSLNETYNERLT